MSYRAWGGLQGPLTQSARTISNAAATQLFDSGTGDRTPNERTKSIVITNLAANANNIYVGGSAVTTAAFVVELKPGDPALVIDTQQAGVDTWWAIAANANVTVSIAQIG